MQVSTIKKKLMVNNWAAAWNWHFQIWCWQNDMDSSWSTSSEFGNLSEVRAGHGILDFIMLNWFELNYLFYIEILLGDKVLAASVLDQGKVQRDIYLPIGTLIDGNDRKIHQGKKWIRKYKAPLQVLLYFSRQ